MNLYTEQLINKIKSIKESDDLFPLHNCSICCCPVGWRHRKGDIFFDSNCNCISYWSEPKYVEPNSLDFYTNQEGWRKEFGLKEQPTPTEQE